MLEKEQHLIIRCIASLGHFTVLIYMFVLCVISVFFLARVLLQNVVDGSIMEEYKYMFILILEVRYHVQ